MSASLDANNDGPSHSSVQENDIVIHSSGSSTPDSAQSSPDEDGSGHQADWSVDSTTSNPDVQRIPSSSQTDAFHVLQSQNHELEDRLEQALASEQAARKRLDRARRKIESLHTQLDQAHVREEEALEQRCSKSSTTSSATLAQSSNDGRMGRSASVDSVLKDLDEHQRKAAVDFDFDVSHDGKGDTPKLIKAENLSAAAPAFNDTGDEPLDDSFGDFILENTRLPSEPLYGSLAPDLDLPQRVQELEEENQRLDQHNSFLQGQIDALQEAYLGIQPLLQGPRHSSDAEEQSIKEEDTSTKQEAQRGLYGQDNYWPGNSPDTSAHSSKQHQYSPKRPSRLSLTMNYSSMSDRSTTTGSFLPDEEEPSFDFSAEVDRHHLGRSLANELEEEFSDRGCADSGPEQSEELVLSTVREEEGSAISRSKFNDSIGGREDRQPRPIRLLEFDEIPLRRRTNGDWVLREDKSPSLRALEGWRTILKSTGGRPLRSPTEELDQRLDEFAAGFDVAPSFSRVSVADNKVVHLISRCRWFARGSNNVFIQWVCDFMEWCWLWLQFIVMLLFAVAFSVWRGPKHFKAVQQDRHHQQNGFARPRLMLNEEDHHLD